MDYRASCFTPNFVLFSIKIYFSYPTNPGLDTAYSPGCDAVIFLVFNQFKADCLTPVDGHQFSGENKVKKKKSCKNLIFT